MCAMGMGTLMFGAFFTADCTWPPPNYLENFVLGHGQDAHTEALKGISMPFITAATTIASSGDTYTHMRKPLV